ncbi:MAG: hypothetical protein ACTSUE_21280 [Promethearchaeota archaeon]
MKLSEELKYRYPIIIFISCQILLVFLFWPATVTISTGLEDIIRILVSSVGLISLFVVLVPFSRNFKRRPSRIRLTVLLGVVFFIATIGMKLFTTATSMTWNTPYVRLYYDFSVYALLASIYSFIIFGIEVLIVPHLEENRKAVLKIVTDITFFVAYGSYILMIVLSFFPSLSITGYLEYVMYVVILYYLTMLIIIAGRSLKLARKTVEKKSKGGLLSLAISFFLLVAVILIIFLNSISGSYNKWMETASLGLAIVVFYYIYNGFVKPAES